MSRKRLKDRIHVFDVGIHQARFQGEGLHLGLAQSTRRGLQHRCRAVQCAAMELLAVLAVGFCALLAFGPDQLLKMMLVGVWLLLAVVAAWEPVKWLLLQGGRLVGLAP